MNSSVSPLTPRRLAPAFASALLLATHAAHSQTSTWDGGGANGNWSTAQNWTGDTVPSANNALVFAGTVNRGTTNDFTAGTAFSGIQFNTAGWTLAGNSVTTSGSALIAQTINNASSGANTISLPVVLGVDTTVNIASTGAGTFRLDMSGGMSGSGALIKQGNAPLRLTGANSYTYAGGTQIQGGSIEGNADNVIPSGAGRGDLSVSAGATFFAANTNQSINGLNGGGTVSRNGTNSRNLSIGNGNASGSFSGNINWATGGTASTVSKTGTGTQTFGGTISATNFSVSGGTAIINGSLTGPTTVGVNGTLGGLGTLNSATTVNGDLRPADVPLDATSRLTFANSLTLSSTAETIFDIDGSNYRGVNANGTTTLGGLLTLNFDSPVSVGVFDLFAFSGSPLGSFSAVALQGSHAGSLSDAGGGVWTGVVGGLGFSFSQGTGDLTVVIPEPSTLALFAALACSILALARRRRSC